MGVPDEADSASPFEEDPIGSRPWRFRPFEFGQVEPGGRPEAALSRGDGELLLYLRRLNWVSGPPGVGKSWIGLLAARECMAAGLRVVWVDHDDGTGQDLTDRAPVLEIGDDIRHPDRFAYMTGRRIDHEGRYHAIQWAKQAPEGGFVILDSATTAGAPTDSADARPWFLEHVRPWTAAGLGMLILDHVPKHDQTRGPIGSVAKSIVSTGVMLRLEGRCWTRYEPGTLTLTIDGKDRAGWVPDHDGKAATIRGTWPGGARDGALDVAITKPLGRPTPEATKRVTNKLVDWIARQPDPVSVTEAAAFLDVAKGTARKRLEALAESGQLTTANGPRGVVLYRSSGHFLDQSSK